jgi:hypothetical protein
MPITVAVRSKAWTVVARSDAGIEGSNPTQSMDVCVYVCSVFVLSCVSVVALWRAYHSSKESYRLYKKWLRNWRRGQGPVRAVRAIEKKYKDL